MDLMSVCIILVYLGAVSAAAGHLVEKVNIVDPVMLSCTIHVMGKVDMDSSEVVWSTADQTVAKYANGIFTSYCGFKGRVNMPRKNIEMGNLSLFITYTVYNDYGEYECQYNRQYQQGVTLLINASIPKKAGHSIWIPCYTRRKTCTEDLRANDAISFNWTKGNQNVFCMVRGARNDGRVKRSVDQMRVSDDIDNGNLSLVFPKAYFSDCGIYRCSEQKGITILKVTVHKEEIKISLEESEAFLSLHLYTVDPVNVYFQRDNSSTPVLVCENYTCSQSWKYVESGHKVELDAVTRDDLGTYTVRDRSRDELLCTYIVTVAELHHQDKDILKYVPIIFFVVVLGGFGIFTSCVR